jgi:uncharacterized repeat protein (TIGR02543 family)
VTFISDGAVYTTVVVDPDTSIDAPADPTRSGYTFGGWYFDAGFTTPVTFPYTVTGDITLYAKWNCDYTYTTSGTEATITDYSGPGGDIVIPGVFSSGGTDYTVTAIADGTSTSYAFKSVRKTLTSVTLPDSLTTIGDYAFKMCTALTSVSMGNNVTAIGTNAFYKAGLTSLTLPNSATLSERAFRNCAHLTTLTIPAGVTLGDSVFGGCEGLTS